MRTTSPLSTMSTRCGWPRKAWTLIRSSLTESLLEDPMPRLLGVGAVRVRRHDRVQKRPQLGCDVRAQRLDHLGETLASHPSRIPTGPVASAGFAERLGGQEPHGRG